MAGNGNIYLAVDLGASNGRVLAGCVSEDRLEIKTVHRFSNGPVQVGHRLQWDILGLWREIQAGLGMAAYQYAGRNIESVGVDTWGVDFGLLGRNDELLGNPYCYRDSRTSGVMERVFEVVSADEIFCQTGVQFMEFNSLFQWIAWKQSGSPLVDCAQHLLMIPDLLHWLMTGEKVVEQTNASTTQCYNPLTGDWATELLERFQLPTEILCPIVPPGTRLGPLRPHVSATTGLGDIDVVLPGTHDTASAVMAVPAKASNEETWCFISSGTWSLMGVEIPQPIINQSCRQLNFTNEGGVGGTTRLLKNIMGLWLVQECRHIWNAAGKEVDWDTLTHIAEQATPHAAIIDPNDLRFLKPDNMPATIQEYCGETSQPIPDSPGAIIRCALESLALEYRRVLSALEQLVGTQMETIHVVGGGTQNRLLCQMTADACQRRVIAGPVEATAIGNIMMQAVATGVIGDILEAREFIRTSCEVQEYLPTAAGPWDDSFQHYLELLP